MADNMVKKRAEMTFSVLAQVPFEDKDARKAINLVYMYCKKSACKTDEDEEIWDSVFHHMMPLGDEIDQFLALLSDETPKA